MLTNLHSFILNPQYHKIMLDGVYITFYRFLTMFYNFLIINQQKSVKIQKMLFKMPSNQLILRVLGIKSFPPHILQQEWKLSSKVGLNTTLTLSSAFFGQNTIRPHFTCPPCHRARPIIGCVTVRQTAFKIKLTTFPNNPTCTNTFSVFLL